ncbi:M12 family metallo-peptidase [Pseudomonas xanthosomatis]|uniref:M12 family metallo-peptidase n=1 Tax=Pseudomonas xanthosomatis TaxID=2842356 RepID=UPI00351536C1
MPSPTGYTWASSVSLSGNNIIDSLLAGSYWNTASYFTGNTTPLTYSFIVPGVSMFLGNYSDNNEYNAAYALTAAQKTAVVGALAAWSAVADIKFTQVAETKSNVGDLRFGGYSYMDSNAAAWAYYPSRSPSGGDVWIGKATNEAKPVAGSYDYMTFMHEIGHALGLKHPFEASGSSSAVLPAELDDVRYTLMSYNNTYYNASHTAYAEPSTPMLLDILVMQRLYGANMKWHAGNDTYSFKPDQIVFQTLWDAGGIDTLDASNQKAGVLLNLNEGAFSNIGALFYDVARDAYINDGLAIAYGAKIENATGSAFNDTLIGNDLDNLLDGRAGADIMKGGLGNDTYIVDNAADQVIELADEGTDTVKASVSYVLGDNLENLELTGRAAINGSGNALSNRITGNAGNNVLDGGAGADTLIGGAGNDTYIVDDLGDVVIEGANAGIDTVRASVSYVLGANLENLELTGSANLNGTGNALANVLTGNTGNNILDGGLGADRMLGGQGDDTYYVDNARDVVVELADEGRDLVRSSITYVLTANVEDGELLGKANLNLTGNALDNVLTGNDGNNILKGEGGADTLIGGLGNDTYYVDSSDDVIIETSTLATEIDNVFASVSWTLGDNLENLTLLGAANLDAIGNALNNRLTGNTGNNLLDGGAGADIMAGGRGNDTYIVDNVGDQVIEAANAGIDTVQASLDWTLSANVENLVLTGSAIRGTGNALANVLIGNSGDNQLFGGAGNDRLEGGEGNDLLDGGVGIDTMIGGLGDDIYYVDNLRDVVTELADEGHDLVRASISYVLADNIEDGELLGKAALNLTGNALDNVLTGNDGANVLRGGGGADTLIGGLGNDTYYVDSSDDVIIETGTSPKEIDNVFSSVDWALGDNLENLTLTGTDNLNGTGNALNNRITGNDGDNVLDGGEGIDTLIGGKGNDTYVVDNLRDVVIEGANAGIDTVRASVNWTLGANFENLTLTGLDNLNGTGNALNNVIIGNAGNNTLNGGAGNDVLDGGAGDDILIGGLGTDTLTGGAGADRFVFNLLSEIGLGNKGDVITDFNGDEGDRIDLTKIDANVLLKGVNAFTFIGSDDFTGAGQLRFADEVLSGNIDNKLGADGKFTADFEIHLVGVTSFSADHLVSIA